MLERTLSGLARLSRTLIRWRHAHLLGAALVLAGLTTMVCWEAVANFGSRLWGDPGDSLQTLWNGWWMGEALSRGISPMFTPMLWHPDGISMWLHTFGPVNAFLTAAGRALLPGFAGFNLVVFLHVWLAGLGGYLLGRAVLSRAVGDGRLPGPPGGRILWLCALAGGAAFAFSPYLWTHIQGHLHVISTGPVALFAHALVRSADRPGFRWPVIAGMWALVTVLCGWYVFVGAVLLGLGVLIGVLLRARRERFRPVLRVSLAGGVALLLCLPPLVAALHHQDQPLNGKHDATVFSADLQSLVVPAPSQWLGEGFLPITRQYTGWWENSGYLGYLALALSLVGLGLVRARWLLTFFLTGGAAVILSLGPYLHVGGEIHRGISLPYHWLASLFPVIDGLGCPVRLGLAMNLALGLGVASGCAWLAGWLARRGVPAVVAALAVLVPAVLVVVEYLPPGQVTSRVEVPGFLEELRGMHPGSAAVDFTDLYRQLYYQMHHHHPLVGGYTSRVPTRIEQKLKDDPVLGPLYLGSLYRRRTARRVALRRVDPRIEFDWKDTGPAPEVAADFGVKWRGRLSIRRGGEYTFILGSDDDARLFIDGKLLVDNPGKHPYQEKRAIVTLSPGPHPVRIEYQDRGARARISWRWQGAGIPGQVVPREVLTTPDERPGLLGTYTHRVPAVRLSGQVARRHLLGTWGLRFLLVPAGRWTWTLEHRLGLERLDESRGVVLYRVPDEAGREAAP